jgi:hypothetical protein
VIVRCQDQEHCASITCMIRHYVARRAEVIFDHPHNAALRYVEHRASAASLATRTASAYPPIGADSRSMPGRELVFQLWLIWAGAPIWVPVIGCAGGSISGVLRGEEGGDQGLSHEAAEVFGRPSAADDEQVVKFGRAVGPQDVGGLFTCDAGPEVAGCEVRLYRMTASRPRSSSPTSSTIAP